MKKVLIKIYLVLLSLCTISLIVLSVLGSKTRVGYIEISSFNENDSYSNNYIYSFQVKYYDKIFRNSDIYGVYLVANSLPEYIKEIKMNDNLGTPFGSLVSSKEIIENKVDNVKYILKIKSKIINYSIIFFLLFAILLISNIEKIYLRYINFFYRRYFYIIVIFLCFLILPRIIYICFYEYFDHENYENRNFAKYPDINANFFNYPKMYEEYFNDYLPFKNEFSKIKNYSDIIIFKNILSKDRLLGKDNWLFFEGKTYSNFSNEDMLNAKNILLKFNNELKKRNIEFIFLICPRKEDIYHEYYIRNYNENIDPDSYALKFLEYIKNNTDINIVYLKDELLKYKNKYQLYYKYDFHWNNLGGYLGFSSLMSELSLKYKNIDDLEILKFYIPDNREYYGKFNDVAKGLGLSKFKIFNDDYFYMISNYKDEKYRVVDSKNWATFSAVSTNYSYDKKLFIVRDSYAIAMTDYIAAEFQKSTFCHIKDFDINILKSNIPDIFVIEKLGLNDIVSYITNNIANLRIEEINKDFNTNFND